MSYMGGIGHLMRGSGLEELIETVYTGKTIGHIMKWKTYPRALRAHMLVSTALNKHILNQRPEPLLHLSRDVLDLSIYNMLLGLNKSSHSILHTRLMSDRSSERTCQ